MTISQLRASLAKLAKAGVIAIYSPEKSGKDSLVTTIITFVNPKDLSARSSHGARTETIFVTAIKEMSCEDENSELARSSHGARTENPILATFSQNLQTPENEVRTEKRTENAAATILHSSELEELKNEVRTEKRTENAAAEQKNNRESSFLKEDGILLDKESSVSSAPLPAYTREGGEKNVAADASLPPEPPAKKKSRRKKEVDAEGAEILPGEPSPKGMEFAKWFGALLDETNAPVHRTRTDFRNWAIAFDILVRRGRDPRDIARVCRWARHDEFWRTNFYSPVKLTKRTKSDGTPIFDLFCLKMTPEFRNLYTDDDTDNP